MFPRWFGSKLYHLRPVAAALIAVVVVGTGCSPASENSALERRIDALSERIGINLRNMDPDVRPEDDLYRHVNGNWLVHATLPPDLSSYGTFTEVAAIADFRIAKIVREIAETNAYAPGSTERKISDLYRSTLALVSGEVQSDLEFLAPELVQIANVHNASNLWRAIGMLQAKGVEALFSPRVRPNLHDASRYQLSIEPAALGLPAAEDYLDAPPNVLRDAYCQFIIAVLIATAPERASPDCGALLEFEAALAAAKAAPADLRQAEFVDNRRTQAELTRDWSDIDWPGYFAGLGVEPPGDVNLNDIAFVDRLDGLSREGDFGIWRDYLTVRLVQTFAGLLSGSIHDSWFAFERAAVRGVAKGLPNTVRALSFVNKILGPAIGEIYLTRHFSTRNGRRAATLAEALRRAMARDIRDSDWLSDAGKTNALAKLAGLTFQYGGPKVIPDYSALDIRTGDSYGNLKRAWAFEVQHMLGDIGQPVDRNRWPIKPQTANAYYDPPTNQIFLPAAILLPPFFLAAGDKALNFGALGAIIGHELMHAFDDQGRKYNAAGVLENWWTAEDAAAFERRVARLVDQIEAASPNYTRPVDGPLVVGEALSDFAGLAAAYRAYHRATNFRARSREVVGYTGNQRFFLAWAQVWRRMHRDEEAARLLLLDEHPPADLRANLTASNLPGFYAAFHAHDGDGMYIPKARRLSIW